MSAHYNFLTKSFYFCLEIISTRIDMYMYWYPRTSMNRFFQHNFSFASAISYKGIVINSMPQYFIMKKYYESIYGNLLAITFHIKTIFKYIVAVTFSYTSSYIIITAILYLKERTWFIFAQLPDRSHKD